MKKRRAIRIDTEERVEFVLERLFGVLSVTFSYSPPDKFFASIRGGSELLLQTTDTGYVLWYEIPDADSEEALTVLRGFGDVEVDLPKLVALAFSDAAVTLRRETEHAGES